MEAQSANEYVADLAILGEEVEATEEGVRPVIAADPDDDLILACAVKGEADRLVEGGIQAVNLCTWRERCLGWQERNWGGTPVERVRCDACQS